MSMSTIKKIKKERTLVKQNQNISPSKNPKPSKYKNFYRINTEKSPRRHPL